MKKSLSLVLATLLLFGLLVCPVRVAAEEETTEIRFKFFYLIDSIKRPMSEIFDGGYWIESDAAKQFMRDQLAAIEYNFKKTPDDAIVKVVDWTIEGDPNYNDANLVLQIPKRQINNAETLTVDYGNRDFNIAYEDKRYFERCDFLANKNEGYFNAIPRRGLPITDRDNTVEVQFIVDICPKFEDITPGHPLALPTYDSDVFESMNDYVHELISLLPETLVFKDLLGENEVSVAPNGNIPHNGKYSASLLTEDNTDYELAVGIDYTSAPAIYYSPTAAGNLTDLRYRNIKVHTFKSHRVTFDLNYDEAGEPIKKYVKDGQRIGEAAPSPERAGFDFTGWYTAPETSAENKWNASNPITKNTTLYAGWEPEAQTFDVTFDAGEHGSFESGAPVTIQVKAGEAIGDQVPPLTVEDGYEFLGWQKEGSDDLLTNEQLAQETIDAAATYTAQYQPQAETETFNVTFYPGEHGSFENGAPVTVQVKAGETIGDQVPALTVEDGYEFLGWKKEGSDDLLTNEQLAQETIDAAAAYTAQYQPQAETETFNVTFNAGKHGTFENGATVTIQVKAGEVIGDRVPALTVEDDYQLAGWSKTLLTRAKPKTLTTAELAQEIINQDVVYTATYTEKPKDEEEESASDTDNEEPTKPDKEETAEPDNESAIADKATWPIPCWQYAQSNRWRKGIVKKEAKTTTAPAKSEAKVDHVNASMSQPITVSIPATGESRMPIAGIIGLLLVGALALVLRRKI